MLNLTVLIGLPGAGKSTLCQKLIERSNTELLSSDEIREEFFGYLINNEIKNIIFKELLKRTNDILKKNIDVIIDSTYLNIFKNRLALINSINQENYFQTRPIYKKIIFIDTDISECIARDRNRQIHRQVGQEIIISLSKQIVIPNKNEGWDKIEHIKS